MTREWERAYAEAYPDRLADYVDGQVPDGGVTDEPPAPDRIAKLEAEVERLREALEQIDRMHLMPDDKINRTTLSAARQVARAALRKAEGGE